MFEGLKNKLRDVRSRFGASIEETIQEAPKTSSSQPDSQIEQTPESLPYNTPEIPAGSPHDSSGSPSQKRWDKEGEKKVEKTSFFAKVKTLVVEREFILTEKDLKEPLFELEMILLESDVALPVTDAIIAHMRSSLLGRHRKVRQDPGEIVTDALRNALREVLGEGLNLPLFIRSHEKPVKILFTGVNGTGKTTSIAKVADFLSKAGLTVVIGAGDTYRAGAIEQIAVHAQRLGIRLIHHQEGADPSAVLFDTVEYARAHKIDVVLADTAGRFHNRANLMSQLEKIRRVMKPDLILYVDEATAGNDAVIRAAEFERTVGADGVILTKADMDPKGGSAISIAYTIGKPLVFLGVGQEYSDIIPFSPDLIINEILLDDA
ncbi:signal recognition particle-docking protein FtsY [Methanocalculus sp.]|uniref:signal recognition particle-docking protein FtsY n=1 Tax=Methanocalculus sp. TaxID=2004547 RepID=UPI002725E7AD|nr:signal recognition particle-docking protein FtsY [Methanocalculus sp.]MDO8841420.1 signal recognition particle-docking protein FtsY [Methanocalculus sp.]